MRQLLKISLTTVSFAALIASSLTAQTNMFQSKRLVGWADLPSPNAASYLELQEIAGCKPAQTFCKYPANAPLSPQALMFWAGGTAYDARNRSAWVSDGKVLGNYLVRGCKPVCKPIKASIGHPAAYVSGLAIAQKKPRLFQLASTPYYFEVATYDLKGCPKLVSQCKYAWPTTGSLQRPTANGLAYDEVHDLLYISVSHMTATGDWLHFAIVSKPSSPCKPICQIKIMPSSKKFMTGLAWDNCAHVLYATDGNISQGHHFTKYNHCQPKIAKPCDIGSTTTWRGLCLIPGQKQIGYGKPCTSKPCQSCPTMWASTVGGDPVFGNQNFGFSLANAPTNSIGIFLLRYGPLSATGVPMLCGRLYATNGPIIMVGFKSMGGFGTCGGNGVIDFPLPTGTGAYNALCGKPLSGQWITYCKTGSLAGFGGVSNAIQFTVNN